MPFYTERPESSQVTPISLDVTQVNTGISSNFLKHNTTCHGMYCLCQTPASRF